jgi:predicted house-cleaning noncanonical NTP pyrophosphatase (MazG superfamily)
MENNNQPNPEPNDIETQLEEIGNHHNRRVIPEELLKVKKIKEEPKWEDITSFMKEVSEELGTDHLVARDPFTVHEAMSSLEIMDPKMDSGMNAENIKTIEEAIELNSLPKELTPQQVIGVMDRLFVLEAMWYEGFPMAQTLNTCLYLYNPDVVPDPTLKAFIRAMLQRCNLVREVVLRADLYEEEDFLSSTFGLNLQEKVEEEVEIYESIKKVEEELAKKENVEALLARIRFAKAMLAAHRNMEKPACKGLDLAKDDLDQALQQLPIISSTISQGTLPDAVFEPEIARRLHSSIPPRFPPPYEFEVAVQKWTAVAQQLKMVCNLPSYNSLKLLELGFEEIGKKAPNIVVRSRMLKVGITPDLKAFGQTPLKEWILKSAAEDYHVPKHLLEHTAFKNFIDKISKTYLRYFRFLAMNKARQRRKFSRHIEEWCLRASEGDLIEDKIGGGPQSGDFIIGYWMTDRLLRIMVKYLQLGFELQLYEPYEYLMIFWYLDNLYSYMIDNYRQLLHKTILNTSGPKRRNKKADKKKPVKKADPSVPLPETPFTLEMELQHNLIRGLLRVIAACSLEKKVPQLELKFGSGLSRFNSRFLPFLRLNHPPHYSYAQFLQTTDLSKIPADKIFKGANEAFKASKTCIEKLIAQGKTLPAQLINELKTAYYKVTVTNSVNLALMEREQKQKNPNTMAKFDFGSNPYFPIVSLQ